MEPKVLIFFSIILLETNVHSALNIQQCLSGLVTVTEDNDVTITCGQYRAWIEWYSPDDSKLRYYISGCSGTSCNAYWNNKFKINAMRTSQNPSKYTSNLVISTATREEAGFYSCKDLDSLEKDSCRLRVTVPARILPENCNVWISNWKVQGECQVARMYSSDSVYNCTWSENDAELSSGFKEPLTEWTDWNQLLSLRTYMRGNCFFSQNMPTYRYNYTYKISIDPGLENIIVKTIRIEPPEDPKINCPETVLEGYNVSCMCTSPNTGNPPASFVWDGLYNHNLLLRNVSRHISSTNYTCRQTWGPYGLINTTVSYIFMIAYGPSDVNISIVSSKDGTGTLICTAIDVFPSALIHWNISCDERTDTMNTSTCTLPARDTDGEIVVLCTASNQAFPDLSVTQTFTVNNTDEQNIQAKDSSSSGNISGGLIGGIVAAVMFAVILGAVIIVFIVKRRKEEFNRERLTSRLWPRAFKFFHKRTPLSTPYTTVTKPSSTTPIKRLAAPSGDLYTTATNTISVDYTTATNTISSDVSGDYVTVNDTIENTVDTMDREGTFMASQSKHTTTDLKEAVKPTITPTTTIATTKNVQDTTGSIYMNVTEVPTDSGLGVYHIVPWRTISSQETDTKNDSAAAAAVSEDEYNALNFEEDRSGQEDQAATYQHLEHE